MFAASASWRVEAPEMARSSASCVVSNSTGTGSPEGRGGGPSLDRRDSIPGRIPFIGAPHGDLSAGSPGGHFSGEFAGRGSGTRRPAGSAKAVDPRRRRRQGGAVAAHGG